MKSIGFVRNYCWNSLKFIYKHEIAQPVKPLLDNGTASLSTFLLCITMQSFSKVSAPQTSCGAYGLHGSLTRQASIIIPTMSPMMAEGNITHWKKERDAFAAGETLLEFESDFGLLDSQDKSHSDSPFILVSSLSPSTPISGHPSSSANIIATNGLVPPGPFSPPFSPLTPTMSPRSPSFLEKHRMGYWYNADAGQSAKRSSRLRPGLLELNFSSYPTSPRFPLATIPSPFRLQLQEDVGTTPFPRTPLTARWPVSDILRSACIKN